MRKLLEVVDMSVTYIVVIASHMYAYVQSHQIIYSKHVKFFVYQLYLNRVVNFL